MDALNDIIKRIYDNSQPAPSPAEMLSQLKEYPYFGLLALAWLRRTAADGMLYDAATRREIAAFAVLANPALGNEYRYLITDLAMGDETDEDFYPPEDTAHKPDTFETIDIFLDTFTQSDSNEASVIENLIMNPVVDYSEMLAAEEKSSKPQHKEAQAGSDDDLINKFILSHGDNQSADSNSASVDSISAEKEKPEALMPPPVPERGEIKKAEPGRDDAMLAESLAKMHIVRKNYQAAYEIINKLNLNYPKKSVYFAVQLRYLEKLILNSKLLSEEKVVENQ